MCRCAAAGTRNAVAVAHSVACAAHTLKARSATPHTFFGTGESGALTGLLWRRHLQKRYMGIEEALLDRSAALTYAKGLVMELCSQHLVKAMYLSSPNVARMRRKLTKIALRPSAVNVVSSLCTPSVSYCPLNRTSGTPTQEPYYDKDRFLFPPTTRHNSWLAVAHFLQAVENACCSRLHERTPITQMSAQSFGAMKSTLRSQRKKHELKPWRPRVGQPFSSSYFRIWLLETFGRKPGFLVPMTVVQYNGHGCDSYRILFVVEGLGHGLRGHPIF